VVVVKNAVVVVKNVVVLVKNGEAHFFDSPRFVAENEVFFRRGATAECAVRGVLCANCSRLDFLTIKNGAP